MAFFIKQMKTDKGQSCLRKLFHHTLLSAEEEAERFFIEKGETVQPYKCRYCVGYHVGHQQKKYSEENSCPELSYKSKQDANRYLWHKKRGRIVRKKDSDAYKCSECGSWHIRISRRNCF